MLIKGATHNLIVRTRAEVALYVLNQKRAHLRSLEERFRISITVSADATVSGQQSYVIDRGEQVHTPEAARNLAAAAQSQAATVDEEEDSEFDAEAEADAQAESESEALEAEGQGERGEGEHRRRRRRRGRGRGRGRSEAREGQETRDQDRSENGSHQDVNAFTHETVAEHAVAHEDHDGGSSDEDGVEQSHDHDESRGLQGEDARRRRRRGRRGGRRNRRRNGEPQFQSEFAENGNGEAGTTATSRPMQHPIVSDEDASDIAPPFNGEPSGQPIVAPQEETPRRRSTVREPVTSVIEAVGTEAASQRSSAASQAASGTSSSSEQPASPKRGWWAKRFLGNKE
jgi:ribonuclease E